MKPDLLNDTISQGEYPEFRARLEREFRAEVRRKRWKRPTGWLAIAAAVTLIAFLNIPKTPEAVTQKTVPPPDAVPTIKTAEIKSNDLLISPKEPFAVIRTHEFTASVIATDRSKNFPSISDDELLRLFPTYPTGLMASHAGKRFLFLDPADAKRFMSANN